MPLERRKMKKIIFLIFVILGDISLALSQVPTYDKVAKLYVATFSRAPDADGLEYWVYKSNLSLEGVAKSFFDQPETKALYPSNYSNSKFIDAIYSNVFGRKADKEGKEYWLNDLNKNKIDRATYILAVINGALGDDAVLLENKTEVALEFVQRGLNDAQEAREIMKYVTANPKSVNVALEKLNSYTDETDNSSENCSERGEDEYCLDVQGGEEDLDLPPPYTPEKIGWYLRLIAEAKLSDGRRFIQKKSGVFGEYKYSIDGKDRHDIKAYGSAILRVVFVHSDWSDGTTYFSDYRNYQGDTPRREVWTIQIRNDKEVNLAKASLRLSLDGLYEVFDNRGVIEEKLSKDQSLKESLSIVDVDNGSVYVYGNSTSIDLSMDGKHVRTFRIVMGDVRDDDYKPVESVNSRSLFRIEDRSAQRGFGLPPSL